MLKQGISLAEAAKRLGMSQSDLYVAVQKGQIPTFRRDRRTVITSGALREYQIRQCSNSDYKLS
ncbi:MAG: helix-turn-helix domain-containing protein [Aulosira sp. ZfuVER01]|nr:helix-turn-helix domain-containing protein [Aulosira sp. ZfuVER01]MDZ7998275.1 helix-turn-helix domain-containing protein [Aulosira sp. DedVER01a]MDZ8050052.1 helix-turn-helix domain-containing protein [Aulosira sp. ZfuCHP01]